YSALSYSIELRRAPWIFWIKDLSQYDPYYVIPILMAVAMFVQQKMTPTANVDPAQAKMMMIMPLMFTFMFLFYSSGLALYWLTGSIIGIGQQVFINKYWSPQAEAKIRARARPDERSGTYVPMLEGLHKIVSTEDTIAAISTPVGQAGIGIIRMSGSEARSITERFF